MAGEESVSVQMSESSVGVLVKQLPDKIISHFGDLALDLAGFKRGAIKKKSKE